MPTLVFQVKRRMADTPARKAIIAAAVLFTAFMLIGRLVAGVHWLTDIIGSVILSAGLFIIYHSLATAKDP